MAKVDGLTPQRRLFASEYLIDRNGTKAAIRAGYAKSSARTQGARLMANADIRALVDLGLARLEAVAVEAAELSVADVVRELRGILLADPLDMLDADGGIKPLEQWPQPLRRALSGFDVDARTGKVMAKPRFWNKLEAAKLLLLHLGGFERHNEQLGKSHAELINNAADSRGARPTDPADRADDTASNAA